MGLFGLDERAQGEWSSIYLIIIFIIAALLLIGIVKPMFKSSQEIVKTQPVLSK
ncbi:MAG: hypothetical protein HYW50_01015 [Candidatus Diapherotrites archaeon]|nr:hypothetical protein [Candidatus Diapherotrites archaeon]